MQGLLEAVLAELQKQGIKQERPDHYRSNSPLRPDSDSRAFTLWKNSEGRWVYKDHVTGEHGSLFSLARHLGVYEDVPQPRLEHTKRRYSGLADYALAHGVTADVFAAAGWRDKQVEWRPALEFQTASGPRVRFLDDQKPHYKSPPGYKASWYRLDEAKTLASRSNTPLILCNGEASAVVAQFYGLGATCVTGGSERELRLEHLEQLRAMWTEPVMIVMDCDRAGRKGASNLRGQLRRAGFDAVAVDLELGVDGADLADWCKLHEETAREALKERYDATRFAEVQRRTALQVQDQEPIEWLVAHQVPRGGFVMLVAPPGAFKSFYALRLAWFVASMGQSVMYVVGEGLAGYADRVAALRNFYTKDGQAAEYLHFWPRAVNLMQGPDGEDVRRLIYEAKEIECAFLILDTLARCMAGGDENSVKDASHVIGTLDELRAELGTGVLVVHHTTKGGRIYRGSSAFEGAADVMIELEQDDDEVAVVCQKTKDEEPFETQYLRPQVVKAREGRESIVLLPSERKGRGSPGKLTGVQREIMEALASPVFLQVGARINQLADMLPHVEKRTAYRAINRLMYGRSVRQEKKGEPFFVTVGGLRLLGGEVAEEALKALGKKAGQEAGEQEGETDAVPQLPF